MKKKQSAFDIWFKDHFGNRPKMGNKTDGEIDALIFLGQEATLVQDRQANWDVKRDAALKAWMAKDLSEDEILRRIK